MRLPRSRFFAVTWILMGSEAYACFAALAADPEGQNQAAVAAVPDERIIGDRALRPLVVTPASQ